MDHIETDRYNSTEFIHSMRNVNRDTSRKKRQNNKRRMKKDQKTGRTTNSENIEKKGGNIDVVIG